MPNGKGFYVVTASSDGAIRIWSLSEKDLDSALKLKTSIANKVAATSQTNGANSSNGEIPQVGQLMGFYEIGNRITCLSAFVMGNEPDLVVE